MPNIFVSPEFCSLCCVCKTTELKGHVTLIDSQLEETSRERDEARELIVWQRQLIQRQLQQARRVSYLDQSHVTKKLVQKSGPDKL